MKIVLDADHLQFISTGTDKMHARHEYQSLVYTLCGRLIPYNTKPQVSRQLSDEQLCGRCYSSLRRQIRMGKAHTEPGQVPHA